MNKDREYCNVGMGRAIAFDSVLFFRPWLSILAESWLIELMCRICWQASRSLRS